MSLKRTRLKPSKKCASRRRMMLVLDDLARQEVFERDEHICVRCRNPERAVQWAHVLSRRHLCLRWNAENAMTLCAGCHLFWHHEPAMALDWYFKTYPERWERISRVLQVNPKVRVKDLYEAR